jgi:hypothetical protein
MNTLDELKIRLETVKDAATRTRAAFIILTTASLAILVAEWNAYMSWCEFVALKEQWPVDSQGRVLEVLKSARADLLSEWVHARYLTVGPLGIQIAADDLPVWGALGLAVIAVWFFYGVRLENHVVAWLLTDSAKSDVGFRREVFIGVLSRLLFVRVTSSDTPYASLPAEIVIDPSGSHRDPLFFRLFRRSSVWLLFLPSLAFVALIGFDLLTYLALPSAFSVPRAPIWNRMPWQRQIHAVILDSICLAIGIFVTFMLVKITQFEAATRQLLEQYGEIMLVEETAGPSHERLPVKRIPEPAYAERSKTTPES